VGAAASGSAFVFKIWNPAELGSAGSGVFTL